MKASRLWSNMKFQGETFGLVDISKKKRNKKKKMSLASSKKTLLSEAVQVKAMFETMLGSAFLSENTKKFLSRLKGGYDQFKRFTPKQFSVFKKIFWQMKGKEKRSVNGSDLDLDRKKREAAHTSEPSGERAVEKHVYIGRRSHGEIKNVRED